jgi:hypothetical protein
VVAAAEGGHGPVVGGDHRGDVPGDDRGDLDQGDGLRGDQGVVDAVAGGAEQVPAAAKGVGGQQVAGLTLEDGEGEVVRARTAAEPSNRTGLAAQRCAAGRFRHACRGSVCLSSF